MIEFEPMKYLKYIGEETVDLIPGSSYYCLGTHFQYYQIIDESGDAYLYPQRDFADVAEQQLHGSDAGAGI